MSNFDVFKKLIFTDGVIDNYDLDIMLEINDAVNRKENHPNIEIIFCYAMLPFFSFLSPNSDS